MMTKRQRDEGVRAPHPCEILMTRDPPNPIRSSMALLIEAYDLGFKDGERRQIRAAGEGGTLEGQTMMTKRQRNAGVAERLGMTRVSIDGLPLWKCDETGGQEFKPATDPDAALWALERYCDSREFVSRLNYYGGNSWSCTIVGRHAGTFCEAICLAVIGAKP